MSKPIRGAIVGAIIGIVAGLGLFSLCSWNYITGAVLGGPIGAILGAVLVIGATMRRHEIDSGLGS